jgi:hypothetical protein
MVAEDKVGLESPQPSGVGDLTESVNSLQLQNHSDDATSLLSESGNPTSALPDRSNQHSQGGDAAFLQEEGGSETKNQLMHANPESEPAPQLGSDEVE